MHSYCTQWTAEGEQYAGKFLTYDHETEHRPAVDNFSCLLFVTQDRRALYLAVARRMPPRPSRVLQAPSADPDQDDRSRAPGASIRYRWAATPAWTGGFTGCRRLSSLPLPLSTAFSASLFFDKFSLISINAVAVERRRAFDAR